ncbi:hypothetical protein BC833DRAFT_617350 [Globomyces pollinis-pini]|nr:hypothetical protein BC833DRAFT_617350 [Globomyces pollinis-pini]
MPSNTNYSIFDFPTELQSLIFCHLNIVEYLNLRMSSVHALLPKIASVTWESYVNSVLRIRNSKWKYVKDIQCSKYLQPHLEFMDHYRLGFMIENSQTLDLRKLEKRNYLTPPIKQQLFEHSIRQNDFDMFFDLVMDPFIDKTNSDNLAIKMAMTIGNVEMCRLILFDPDVNPTDAIEMIDPKSNLECIQLLAEDPRTDVDRLMAFLIENGHTASACELLHTQTSYFTNDDTVLRLSVAYNDPMTLRVWIMYNPDSDSQNLANHASRAILDAHLDCLNVILEDERVLKHHDHELLRCVVRRGDVNAVKVILPLSNCTPKHYNDMLYYACIKGKLDVIKLLLDDGRIDPTDGKTFRPVHGAIVGNHIDCLKYLLEEKDMPVDKPSLGLVCKSGKVECLKLLLSSKRARPSFGVRLAALNGQFQCLQLILNDKRTDVPLYELKSILQRVNSIDCCDILTRYIAEQTVNEP